MLDKGWDLTFYIEPCLDSDQCYGLTLLVPRVFMNCLLFLVKYSLQFLLKKETMGINLNAGKIIFNDNHL